MSLSYFTIMHIIVMLVIFLLSMLLLVLSMRAERKLFWSLLFINILVSTTLCVFLMLVLDKYTKKGSLENVTSERILINESIAFKGKVRNVGNFTLTHCTLSVRLVNRPQNRDGHFKEIFKPSGLTFFSSLFKSEDKDEKPNAVEYKFDVAQNLQKQRSVDFMVSMPYPPYFENVMHITKLSCY